MKNKSIKIFLILLLVVSIIFLLVCGLYFKSKNQLEEYEKFVIKQFKDLYDTDVEVSDGELLDGVYSCKVNVAGDIYDTVVHSVTGNDMEMFTRYETIFTSTINGVVGHNDYWHPEADYDGERWGLDNTYENIICIQTESAFGLFAETLTQLDLDSFQTAYFIRVEYMNNRVFIPIRKEYKAEDYLEMLNKLLPEIEMINKEDHIVMFKAISMTQMAINDSEDEYLGTTYEVFYDGTIIVWENYSISGSKILTQTEMSDYDYSLLRNALETQFDEYKYQIEVCDGDMWNMTYYDNLGNTIYSFDGYIYGSELLEGIILTTLEKYSIK